MARTFVIKRQVYLFSVSPSSQSSKEELENLGEALLDFSTAADLANWFHERP